MCPTICMWGMVWEDETGKAQNPRHTGNKICKKQFFKGIQRLSLVNESLDKYYMNTYYEPNYVNHGLMDLGTRVQGCSPTKNISWKHSKLCFTITADISKSLRLFRGHILILTIIMISIQIVPKAFYGNSNILI